MAARWRVLVLLFLIRGTMAFQFGSAGALGPAIAENFRADAAAIGFLIGLYLSPGLLFALPGGAMARALGDRRVVLGGLALMAVGGGISALSSSWEAQLAGRALGGTGGVLLNVLLAKMVTDWFAGREIATAMALFANSWPTGIGLALLAQPHIVALGGLPAAFGLTAILAAAVSVPLLWNYRQPLAAPSPSGTCPRGAALVCVLIAGGTWGLFNAAFSMIFAFGPMLLQERGWQLEEASLASSVPLWLCALFVPVGGLIADRLVRPGRLIVFALLLLALGLLALSRTGVVVTALVVIGVASGLPVGAIMSLPARVLAPATRAVGMGLFFTVFYASMVASPFVAGTLIDATGRHGTAMEFGAALLVTSILLLAIPPHWRAPCPTAGYLRGTGGERAERQHSN